MSRRLVMSTDIMSCVSGYIAVDYENWLWHLPPSHGTWPHHQITPDQKKRGGLAVFTKSTVKGSSLFWFLPYSLLSGPFHLVWMRPTSLVFLLCSRRLWLPCTDMILNLLLPSPPASAPQPNCWCRQYIQWCVCGWACGWSTFEVVKALSSWEISLYELDTFFFLPAQLWLDSFYLDENLVWPSRKKKKKKKHHHPPPYDLSFFGLDESRSAEQVVITSRQLLSFFFFFLLDK